MNEIYIITENRIAEGEENTGNIDGYYTDHITAIKTMLAECQSTYDEWRGRAHADVVVDFATDTCSVSDGVSGDSVEWILRKLEKKED